MKRFKKFTLAISFLLVSLFFGTSASATVSSYILDNGYNRTYGYTENSGGEFSTVSTNGSYALSSNIAYDTPKSSATGSYRYYFKTQHAGHHEYSIYVDGRDAYTDNTKTQYYIGGTYQRTVDQTLQRGWVYVWETSYQGVGVWTTVKVSNQSSGTGTIGADAGLMVETY